MNNLKGEFFALHRYAVNWWPHGHVYNVDIECSEEPLPEEFEYFSALMSYYNNGFLIDITDPFYTYLQKSPKFVDQEYKFIRYKPQTADEERAYGACALKEGVCRRLYYELDAHVGNVRKVTLIKGPTKELRTPWKEQQSHLVRISHLISDEDNDMWRPGLEKMSFGDLIDACPSTIRDIRDDDKDDIFVMERDRNGPRVTYVYDPGDRYEED